MSRRAHEDRDAAIETMRRLSNEHGVKEGCRLARGHFPGIATPTWGRWRVEAIGYLPEQEARDSAPRARVAHEVRESIPPIDNLVPAAADVIPAQRRAID